MRKHIVDVNNRFVPADAYCKTTNNKGGRHMKSIMILCIATVFLILSAVLSLAVYERGGNAGDTPISQMKRVVTPVSSQIEPIESPASVLPKDDKSIHFHSILSRRVLAWFTQIQNVSNTGDSSGRVFEPFSIFLFGAGLIGLAIFTRRKFDK
jgi:hypothetical protein